MDILVNISHELISAAISKEAADGNGAPSIEFHHIGPTMEPVHLTGNFRAQPTTTVKDCPKLDYLLVAGPAPSYIQNVPEDMKNFIRERSKEVKTIFTTCTGGLVVSTTGLLDNTPATTNHTMISLGDQVSPTTKWDRSKNWVVSENSDGVKFWTAAGASAGMDMMAQWIREEFEHGQELVNFSTIGLEWQPRDVNGKPQTYVNGRMEKVEVV